MKKGIYLTKEYNSDGTELKHNGYTKIGIGKSINIDRRFLEHHHNKGSKATTNMVFIYTFECENIDEVESKIHKRLELMGFDIIKRKSEYGDKTIESRTEVYGGLSRQGEEISTTLIIKLLKFIVSGEEFINITRKEFKPHFLQELSIRKILDCIDNENEIDVNIIAELCARFGKTLTYLELFNRLESDVMVIPSYIHSVFTSFENEILGEYRDEEIGKWTNFVNFKIIDTRNDDKWIDKYKENLGKSKLVVFVSIQTPEESFNKFDIIKNTEYNRKFIVIDEADFGAHTEKSQKVIDYIV